MELSIANTNGPLAQVLADELDGVRLRKQRRHFPMYLNEQGLSGDPATEQIRECSKSALLEERE